MSAVTIIASILIILVAIGLIVVVLMQEGNKQGLGAIGGGAETFFGKSKAKGIEGKLAMITKVLVVVFIALALIMTVVVSRENEAKNPGYTMEELANLTAVDDAASTEETDAVVETETSEESEVETTAEPVAEATEEPTEDVSAEATAEAEE